MGRQNGYNWFIAFRQIHTTARWGHKWDSECRDKVIRISGTQILAIKLQGTFVFGRGRGRWIFQGGREASWNKISCASTIIHIFTLSPLRSKRNFGSRKNRISDKVHILRCRNNVWTIHYYIIQRPPPPHTQNKRNAGRPQLKWNDRHSFQEDGTDHVWPNPWRLWWCYI
jgi:hypothetical protein